MKKLIILKIGGSIITEKRKGKAVIRKKEITRIAREIVSAKNARDFNLIIVHGVGSFGHKMAKKYELWKGIKNPSQIIPFSKTQQQTVFLNQTLLNIFSSVGLPVISINPTGIIFQEGGKFKGFDTRIIGHFLSIGMIPVLYGTVVPDAKLKGSICSGDTMLDYLAEKLKADRSVFATDVDGIYTKDPGLYKDAVLINKITNANYGEVISGTGGSASKIDVGGGMKGKLEEIKQLAPGVKTLIINGQKNGRIKVALLGKKTKGTEILIG